MTNVVSSPKTPIPSGLPERSWQQFTAPGFTQKVSGVIYSSDNPTCCGMPLGGMATGCIDLDVRGVLGWTHIFNPCSEHRKWKNWLYARRTPMLQPLLGISVGGQTWLLNSAEVSTGELVGWCTEPQMQVKPEGVMFDEPLYADTRRISGVQFSRVRYWGHYPVADLAYENDCPLKTSLRAWAPFIPGDAAASNTPAIIFELHLANPTGSEQQARLALSFGGPEGSEVVPGSVFTRSTVHGGLNGCLVHGEDKEYVLGVLGDSPAQFGASLGLYPQGWANLHSGLPAAQDADGSCSAAVDLTLAPGAEAVVRYVLAWYAPRTEGAHKTWDDPEIIPGGGFMRIRWLGSPEEGKTHYYKHMYAAHFADAVEVARRIANEHESLLARVLAWQGAIFGDSSLPPWLQDSLINNLALVTEDSYWFQPLPPVSDVVFPQGGFALNESPRGCPHMSCIPCDWYGNLPIVYFFPDLALSTLRLFKESQRIDGEVPFSVGRIADLPDMATPEYYWQVSLNGMCYITLLDRLWQTTGDIKILREFYSSAMRANTFTMALHTGHGGPIRMPAIGGMEWFEFGEWAGMAAHMGGLRLAGLRMMERMADAMGDGAYAERCRAWFAEGSDAMENEMWAGSYYLNYFEPETEKRSDAIMAYQLDGDWTARCHGLGGVFNEARARQALETIKRCNIQLTPDIGAPNFCQPNGTALGTGEKVAHYGAYTMFVPEMLLLAMTYIQHGDRAFGLEAAHKHWANLCLVQGHTWDMPNMVSGEDGKRLFGTDYYQNMILWALPGVLANEPLAKVHSDDTLVTRVLAAGKRQAPA